MLNVNALKAGDILTFDGERDESGKIDPLSHLIMILTDSEVSHSALFLQDAPPALADAALAGLHAHRVGDKGGKMRPVHVCRLKNADQLNLDPVIKVANKYIEENTVYPMPDLVMLGMILVYKNVSHVSLRQTLVIKLLKVITAKIKSILDKKHYQGKHPMTCSEFVFQCYFEATEEYPELQLILRNGDLQASLRQRTSTTLLDHFINYTTKQMNSTRFTSVPQNDEPVKESETELIEEAITDIRGKDLLLQENPELSLAVRDFLIAQQRLMEKPMGGMKELIDNARVQQAYFVTPNDLLCHISNANNLGKFEIYRDDAFLR